MSSSQANIIRDRIDNGPVSFAQFLIIAIGFLLNCVDGFDVVAISVAAPSLSASWSISSVELGYILSAALFGMMMGALFLAPLGDQYGRRKIVLCAVFITGTSMIITAFIENSVSTMIIVRAVSGIGIGAIFASAATFGSEFTPEKYKNFAVTFIISGYPFGAMIVGPVAALILPSFGWEMLFISGGVATLVIFVAAYFLLPESVQYMENSKGEEAEKIASINKVLVKIQRKPIDTLLVMNTQQQASKTRVNQLLSPELMKTTIKLWIIFFMGFLTIYFLISWIPSLFVNSGFTMKEGIYALTLNNLGAIFGTTCIGIITTKYKLSWPIGGFFAATAIFMAYFTYSKPTDLMTLYFLIFIIGMFINGAFSAMYAVTARIYNSTIRSTGIGWCAGLGRTGAMVAPILAGYLIATNFSMYSLFTVFAIPAVIAAILIVTIRV